MWNEHKIHNFESWFGGSMARWFNVWVTINWLNQIIICFEYFDQMKCIVSSLQCDLYCPYVSKWWNQKEFLCNVPYIGYYDLVSNMVLSYQRHHLRIHLRNASKFLAYQSFRQPILRSPYLVILVAMKSFQFLFHAGHEPMIGFVDSYCFVGWRSKFVFSFRRCFVTMASRQYMQMGNKICYRKNWFKLNDLKYLNFSSNKKITPYTNFQLKVNRTHNVRLKINLYFEICISKKHHDAIPMMTNSIQMPGRTASTRGKELLGRSLLSPIIINVWGNELFNWNSWLWISFLFLLFAFFYLLSRIQFMDRWQTFHFRINVLSFLSTVSCSCRIWLVFLPQISDAHTAHVENQNDDGSDDNCSLWDWILW